ncbi:MAG: hypothetical protein QOF15_39 [Mycobacterium sp.]|nr:hypothetical protein [Mycobacterium sp.]
MFVRDDAEVGAHDLEFLSTAHNPADRPDPGVSLRRIRVDDVDSHVDRPRGLWIGDLDDHDHRVLTLVPVDAGNAVPRGQFHDHRILPQQEPDRCAQLSRARRHTQRHCHVINPPAGSR